MGKRIGILFVLMILFFPVHMYVTGSIMALWKIVDTTPWKANQIGQKSPVIVEIEATWKKNWLRDPLGVIERVASPHNAFDQDVQKRTLWATPVVYLLVFYVSYIRSWKKRKYEDASKYGSHGTSRWATAKEIFRRGELNQTPVCEKNGPGVVLGYLDQTFRKTYVTLPPDSELNQNIVLYGGSGIGKSFTWVKTQILNTIYPFNPKDTIATKIKIAITKILGPLGNRLSESLGWPTTSRAKVAKRRRIPREYSIVVVDPKGENYTDTAGILEKHGYKVWVINFINFDLSAHWNPMDYVHDDLDAERLASTIIYNSSLGNRSGGDPFWERAENALLTSLILFVKYELPKEQHNLTSVLQIVLSVGPDEEELDRLFDNLPFNHPAKMKYNIFRLSQDKTRAGILIGFATHLQLWTNQKIQDLTAQSDFYLGDLGREKTALFLVLPDSDTTFKTITSLFFAQCFQEWWRVARDHDDTLPVGIRLIMDEFANIGYIPDFAERMSVMRSKGVSAQIILQLKSQLDNLYKDSADIIVAACDTTVFLGTNDNKTAEAMSKDLGDATIRIQSSTIDPKKYLGKDKSLSEQYQERKLMKPEELKRLSRKYNIIVQNGSYPFKTLKTPFIKHPLYRYYEERPLREYKPPKTKPYSVFDFHEYMMNNGYFDSIFQEMKEEQSAINEEQSKGLDILDNIQVEEVEDLTTVLHEEPEEEHHQVSEDEVDLSVLESEDSEGEQTEDYDLPNEDHEYHPEDQASEVNEEHQEKNGENKSEGEQKPRSILEYLP